MNVVMIEEGAGRKIIEIQGTAEGAPFSHQQLLELLALADDGIKTIFQAQKKVLEK